MTVHVVVPLNEDAELVEYLQLFKVDAVIKNRYDNYTVKYEPPAIDWLDNEKFKS